VQWWIVGGVLAGLAVLAVGGVIIYTVRKNRKDENIWEE
jgi:hypothetical protein